ncbi:hypothetical protein EDD85DRAFT_959132 [Armillaria nabsnona]|nr:hypothetical protein EDD85DRAFT_959132 [Armillaria nabsnona]
MDDEDNVADEATLKAWFMQLDYLIANAGYQGHPNLTVKELKVIKQRQAQHRGEIKMAAHLFVSNTNTSFKFLPSEDASTIKHNQALVKAMKTQSAFTFKVLCAIDKWKSRKHEPNSVSFHTATYKKPYNDILMSLKGWELYCCDTRKESDVPANFCKELFKQGRLSAGVLDKDLNEENPSASDDSVFGATDFAADFTEPVATV